MAKLLTLEEWATEVYGEHAPKTDTLRMWARTCRIYPAPEKHGRTYFVRPDARYCDPRKPLPAPEPPVPGLRLVDRIRTNGAKA